MGRIRLPDFAATSTSPSIQTTVTPLDQGHLLPWRGVEQLAIAVVKRRLEVMVYLDTHPSVPVARRACGASAM